MSSAINIAYTPTNDTFYMTLVSITSLFKNNKSNKIVLHIFHDRDFSNKNINDIKKYVNYNNCSDIKFYLVDKDKYLLLSSKVAFNERLYCFEFPYLVNTDKLLYLNSFSIVNGDLKELYGIDLSVNSCAAVQHIFPSSIAETCSIEKTNVYINNVMLLNLKIWRNENFYEKFISGKFLNSACNNKKINDIECFNIIINDCKKIPLIWNYTEFWHIPRKDLKCCCDDKTKQMYNNLLLHNISPSIISFIGPKPIGEIRCRNSYIKLWWKYAELSPIYDLIKKYKHNGKYKLAATTAQNSFKYTWLLSRIWPYIKPYWFRITLGFLIAIPLGLLDGVTAFALKPYMDYVVGGKAFIFNFHGLDFSISSIQMSFIIPFGVILFAIVQGVLRYLNGYFSSWVSAHITNDVKFDLFKRLVYMDPQFFDENSSGIIISRYMSDPTAASAGIVENIKTITTSFFGAFGLIAVMLYSSWKLAFIGVLVLCIAFLPVALIRKRIKEASNKSMVIGGNITTNINETYTGNKVMAAYGLQDKMYKYFEQQTWDGYNIGMSLYKRTGWMSPLMYLIASFGIATVLGYGTYLINSNQMSAGSFASFVTSLLLLYKPVKTLGNTLTGIQGIFVAMGRVFELFDLEPEIKDNPNAKALAGLNKSIKFEDVCFEYIPNQPVLKHLNLTVAKNETLAIVGNSGGGKSTLVNLLPRFYDIKTGSIKFDDVDIREYTIKSLRENISMVFQDNFLYSGTIRENILMGNPNATSEELVNAIKSAHLEEMIKELPDGLETELGERGLTLSGGQRQRVAIARAMIKNAPIVILDEATSALDNESEAIVQKAMDNLMKDRTVFIIAHRLSTIKNADRIAVINEGQLVELGTHNELMNIENGQYKALYEMQFKKQEVGV